MRLSRGCNSYWKMENDGTHIFEEKKPEQQNVDIWPKIWHKRAQTPGGCRPPGSLTCGPCWPLLAPLHRGPSLAPGDLRGEKCFVDSEKSNAILTGEWRSILLYFIEYHLLVSERIFLVVCWLETWMVYTYICVPIIKHMTILLNIVRPIAKCIITCTIILYINKYIFISRIWYNVVDTIQTNTIRCMNKYTSMCIGSCVYIYRVSVWSAENLSKIHSLCFAFSIFSLYFAFPLFFCFSAFSSHFSAFVNIIQERPSWPDGQ